MTPGRARCRQDTCRAGSSQSALVWPVHSSDVTSASTGTSTTQMSIGSTSSRVGCGRAKNTAFQRLLQTIPGHRIRIEIPEDLMKPVGDWCQAFITEAERDPAPLHKVAKLYFRLNRYFYLINSQMKNGDFPQQIGRQLDIADG